MYQIILFFLLYLNAESNDFNKIIENSGLPRNTLGIHISQNGQLIFGLNNKQKFIPASLSKIMTGIASYKMYGTGHRFQTQLLTDAKIEDQVLKGKIYLKGGGDPSLVSENMWVLVNHFLRNDIKKIDGPIVIDNSIYDEQFIDTSREDARVDRAYDSPISATPFNWNTVSVYVRPGSAKGKPVKVFFDPENSYFKLVNRAVTSSGSGQNISVNRSNRDIVVSGNMGVGYSEKVFYKNIDNPVEWVGQGLIDFLSQRGIEVVNKKIVAGTTPNQATLLSDVEGWSIDELTNGMLRFSNNFIAEMITKNIALKAGASRGSIKLGVQQIKKIMANYGLKEDEYIFENPSGLSRENKFSADQLGLVMEGARKDFLVSSGFMNGLPYPSVEGSLSKRMNGLEEKRWVRAKTGLLTGVVGLAGYVGQTKKDPIVFAFIYNGNGREDRARALFDQLAMELVEK